MRWHDVYFADPYKQLLHDAVKRKCSIELHTRDKEAVDRKASDILISQAFGYVRALLYRLDKDGIWVTHNAEYGLLRNIVGSRHLWLFLSVVSAITGGLRFGADQEHWFGLVLGLGSMVLSITLGYVIFPALVKTAAELYASSAWGAFLTLDLK